ncbi:hypothetical protein SISSUDRAFT_834283 [Sistotremastrum suecicum HHB10207 ss-3]|uniref:Uncharacterized protein n=1 Tax=Sistotremastrum suecicum HHB10207 ss-3 TaxID=1314776 RepID=A0A166CM36_9AGAM|nr:hypothetical protein SISSUDRAFT_834283 [Sistotremastrum suecicum HHB10207 ss-3]
MKGPIRGVSFGIDPVGIGIFNLTVSEKKFWRLPLVVKGPSNQSFGLGRRCGTLMRSGIVCAVLRDGMGEPTAASNWSCYFGNWMGGAVVTAEVTVTVGRNGGNEVVVTLDCRLVLSTSPCSVLFYSVRFYSVWLVVISLSDNCQWVLATMTTVWFLFWSYSAAIWTGYPLPSLRLCLCFGF